jgi:hypothetical protein
LCALADAAAWRAQQLDGLAVHDHDAKRRGEYEALAKEWHAKAAALKREELALNDALAKFARG